MGLSTIEDRSTLAEALANTYGGNRLGWERVQEYQRVMAFAAAHPNKGSSAVASKFDLPRGRIRPWLESQTKPDPVSGIDIAEKHGWLDLTWKTKEFTALNILVAWVFAGGSIDILYRPSFTIDDEEQADVVEYALSALGLPAKTYREADDHRAMEMLPNEDASVLGRLLTVLGAPRGEKSPQASIHLPDYLDTAPEYVRLNFARTYVWIRGSATTDRPNWPVVFREDRSPEFKRKVQRLFRAVVGDQESVMGSVEAPSMYLSKSAAKVLMQPPILPDDSEDSGEADDM